MRFVTFASIILLAFTAAVSQQDEKVTFHVTSVEQSDATDYCTTGKCSATRITVEGYTQDKDAGVQYVLDCVEVIANEPTPHKSIQCVKEHSRTQIMWSQSVLTSSSSPVMLQPNRRRNPSSPATA